MEICRLGSAAASTKGVVGFLSGLSCLALDLAEGASSDSPPLLRDHGWHVS